MYPPLWTRHLVALHDDIGNRSNPLLPICLKLSFIRIFQISYGNKNLTMFMFSFVHIREVTTKLHWIDTATCKSSIKNNLPCLNVIPSVPLNARILSRYRVVRPGGVFEKRKQGQIFMQIVVHFQTGSGDFLNTQ